MLGTRLRQARLAAGLSLEGLAAKLEHPVSKQALSKYEKGLAQPNPTRISDISQALNVTASSLLAEDAIEIKWEAFRKHAKLSKARQNQLTAIAQQKVEAEFRLRRLFHLGDWHDLPGPIEVRNFNDCEYAAATLRMHWSLGDRPIDGLLELIEERGGSIIGWHQEWGFDALSGWAGRSPILVLNTAVPPDRQRFNAAHELGHLVMEQTGDAKMDELFAHRFAAAFLVPAEAARRELGTHRRGLDGVSACRPGSGAHAISTSSEKISIALSTSNSALEVGIGRSHMPTSRARLQACFDALYCGPWQRT